MENEKIAIYCRVDEGGSEKAKEQAMQIQRFKLKQYAETNGLHISCAYEDIGHPGYEIDRPGLQKLLSDYHADKFKYVLVTNIDRIFRGLSQKKDLFPFHIKSINSL